MRKLVLSFMMFVSAVVSIAQTSAPKYKFKKAGQLGIHFTTHDFATAADIKKNGISDALFLNKQWKELSKKSAGVAFTYTSGLSDHLDVMARVGGTFVSYPVPDKMPSGEKFLLEADVNLNVKLLTDNFIVVPYLSVGAGASTWNGYAAAYIPFGGGLQVRLADDCFIQLQTQYRAPVTGNNGAPNLFFGFGITANISK